MVAGPGFESESDDTDVESQLTPSETKKRAIARKRSSQNNGQ